jgi:hypothetical protein
VTLIGSSSESSCSESAPLQEVKPAHLFVILRKDERSDRDLKLRYGACRTLGAAKELAKKHCESKELTDKKGKVVCVADVGDGMELRIEKCELVDGTVGLYSFLFYRLWLSMIFVTQEDEKKTSATAPESTNESATPITPLHYAYTNLAEKSDY